MKNDNGTCKFLSTQCGVLFSWSFDYAHTVKIVMSRDQGYELSHWDNRVYGLPTKTSGVWFIKACVFPLCSSMHLWLNSSPSSNCRTLINTMKITTITRV